MPSYNMDHTNDDLTGPRKAPGLRAPPLKILPTAAPPLNELSPFATVSPAPSMSSSVAELSPFVIRPAPRASMRTRRAFLTWGPRRGRSTVPVKVSQGVQTVPPTAKEKKLTYVLDQLELIRWNVPEFLDALFRLEDDRGNPVKRSQRHGLVV